MEQKYQSRDSHKNYLKKLLLIFLVLISVWGCADVFFSFFGKAPAQSFTETEYVQGLGNILRRNYQSNSYNINSYGFRGNELKDVVQDEIRILVLGDSVVFGVGLDQGVDWPTQLEKYLRQQGVPATVINGGQSGMTNKYMLDALKYFYPLLKFDLVVVQSTGNMYALYPDSDVNLDPVNIAASLFPGYLNKDLKAKKECDGLPQAATVNGEVLSVPTLLKKISKVSPAMDVITKRLNVIFQTKTVNKKNSVNQCYLHDGKYIENEMLAMGNLLQFAHEKNLPVVLIKPSYAYSWQQKMSDASLKALHFPYEKRDMKVFAKVNQRISDYFVFFQKYSHAIFVDPVRFYESKHGVLKGENSVQKLYSDYAHYSASGAKLIAQAIGEELIAKKVVKPVEKSEWVYPDANKRQFADLKYKDIPQSLNNREMKSSGVLAIVFMFIVGMAVKLLLFRNQNRYHFIAPLMGFFVLMTGSLFVSHLGWSLSLYFSAMFGASVLFIAYHAYLNLSVLKQAAFYLVISCALFSLLSTVMFHKMTHKHSRGVSHHQQALRSEVAWLEYLNTPVAKRANQNEIYTREIKDGILRPDYIPYIVTTQSASIYPASPSIAVFLAQFTKANVQNIFMGMCVAFVTMLFMCALMFVLMFIKERNLFAFLASIGMLGLTFFTITHLPTSLTMLLLSSVILIATALFSESIRYPMMKYGLLVLGGGVLYLLPAKEFLMCVSLLISFLCFQTYMQSKKIRYSFWVGVVAMLCLFGSRVVMFNIPVTDSHFYQLLVDLHVPRFFL